MYFFGAVCCVAVCCSVLQCVAVCCNVLISLVFHLSPESMLKVPYVAACCSVLQRVAAHCSMLQYVAARCYVLRCVDSALELPFFDLFGSKHECNPNLTFILYVCSLSFCQSVCLPMGWLQ